MPKTIVRYLSVLAILRATAITASDNQHYQPPLECYDPYGRPQVSERLVCQVSVLLEILLSFSNKGLFIKYEDSGGVGSKSNSLRHAWFMKNP